MKSGAMLWGGAAVAVAAAVWGHWYVSQRTAASAQLPVPQATPPGITLQLRAGGIRARRTAGIHVVFADAEGMTLYSGPACTAECLETWPRALAPPSASPDGEWSAVPLGNGTRQWAYRGAPLHRFTGDLAVGDVNGDAADAGGWHAAAFRPGSGMILRNDIAVREIDDAGGAALVDSRGITLYVFDGRLGDYRGTRWLPLQAPAIATAAGDFSIIARADGISQWAYRGKPLFLYDGDSKLLDVKGIGVDSRFRVALVARFYMPADAAIRAQPGLGNILTTVGGATLYQRDRASTSDEGHDFREDHGTPALGRYLGTTTCDAECTKSWPPYAAPADAQPSGYWEIARRPDGTRQWMYKGFALYTYAADKPGETRGNQQYELAQVQAPGIAPDTAHGAAAPIPAADLHEEDPVLPKAGAGISALFWHAVVP